MRILLLGGTGDALHIARHLSSVHIYSVAGLGRTPTGLACQVRTGGFGGAAGLADFIAREDISLLIDATHPYAARISANAVQAAAQCAIPCWALRRTGWQPVAGDDWREFSDWTALQSMLHDFERPFFTLGREPLAHLDAIPADQHWTIRCLDAEPGNARATVIGARGPFGLDDERTLFADGCFDVLVSKNSGGDATEAKLTVARELGLPVLLLRRPELPAATREFDSRDALLAALVAGAEKSPLRPLFAKKGMAASSPLKDKSEPASHSVSAAQYYAGIGCRRGVDVTALRALLEQTLRRHMLRLDQLAGLASIDSKRNEPGLQALARALNLPLRFFNASELAPFEDQVSEPSIIAQRETGVVGIAETSALAACGTAGVLVGGKNKTVAATCALARVAAGGENPGAESTSSPVFPRKKS
jgi:precorrin-6A/cobalt-precorrin-6A reductase